MLMPMFPLGSVLFPGAVLPLQVFEPRYHQLLDDISRADNRFGVVLIRRGFEVGGNEVVRKGQAEEQVVLIAAIGRERIKVTRWLDDDPYPIAEVDSLDDGPATDPAQEAIAAAAAARRRLLALAIEMGADAQPFDLSLSSDPNRAAWALCAAAPIGAFDQQRLLETAGVVDRMRTLRDLLTDQAHDLERALLE